MNVLFTRTTTHAKAQVFKNNPTVQVQDANGSISSIDEWSRAANLDPIQKRAFETIVATFLLTFYDEADVRGSANSHLHTKFNRAKD
jgi:hypothetical protein